MENKEDLLNLNKDKNPKKILIYAAAAFLVFVIGVIVFALTSAKEKKEDNAIIPPEVKEEPLFKEIPIEKEPPKETKKPEEIKKPKPETKEPNVKKEPQEKEIKVEEKVTKPIKEEPKKEVKKESINKQKSTKKKEKVTVKYYIQVAALMKSAKPNKKFLDLLKKYGYNYIIYPVVINKDGKKVKINKLLVGPFSKDKVRKELKRVKKYITQNAFIFKVKE